MLFRIQIGRSNTPVEESLRSETSFPRHLLLVIQDVMAVFCIPWLGTGLYRISSAIAWRKIKRYFCIS